MALDLYEPDFGAAYYRSTDPIKNLNIRIRLERVTTSVVSDLPREDNKDDQTTVKDVEMRTFHWQEKFFSQREIEKNKTLSEDATDLEKKYHANVKAILDKRKPSNRLFTYVDSDSFTKEDESIERMTTLPNEKPSVLATKMSHLRRRKIGGVKQESESKVSGFVPKINTVEMNPSEEIKMKNHIMEAPQQVMYIMADLGARDSMGNPESESILCTISLDKNNVLCIRPDFNRGRSPYVIESGALGRDVYEYTIEHCSKRMNRQEQDKETKMAREVYTRHKDFLDACVGDEFERCPADTLRLLVYGEIESARNFDYDNLYIHFFVDLPKNWTAEARQQLSWVTQTCKTTVVGRDEVAYFSFPFSFELFYRDEAIAEENKEPLPHFPVVLMEVLSLDSWNRFRTEGYTYFAIPPTPGVHTKSVDCWRPLGKSVASEMRRYFIGGSPEIEDMTYMSVPSTFQGSHLSKYGFRTETTGSVDVRMNVVMQSRAFLDNKKNKKSLGHLLDNLGINAMQANISSVLEAFKKARNKMLQARESATRELLRDTDTTRKTKT